jgi:DNA-binding beta-propeller fold protein YncE
MKSCLKHAVHPWPRSAIRSTILLVAALAFATAIPAAASAAGAPGATLDGSPGFPPVANPQTQTLYVPIQCQNPNTNDTCNATAAHVMDVINSATCAADASFGCRIVARAVAGDEPIGAVIDHRTDTIYVGDAGGNGAITVIDGARCNASLTSGCNRPVATIPLNGFPAAEALDPATGTLYVADLNGHVFAIDAGDCNAARTVGCADPVKSIADSGDPDAIAVDIATDTVYAANVGSNENGDTLSVIDGATCNAHTANGCGQTPPTVTVGDNPEWVTVDQATGTVYTANTNDGTVSVLDGATCNAGNPNGCTQTPPTVTTGSSPTFMALDRARHTLFVLNQGDDTMSAIDTRSCNGNVSAGCQGRPANQQLHFNPPQGYNANSFALAGPSDTAFLVNAGDEAFLGTTNLAGCTAIDHSGCRTEAPSAPGAELFPVVDPANHTLYAGNTNSPDVDVFNTDTCHAGDLGGCAPVAEIPMPDPQANLGGLDQADHTLYASDPYSDTISVIDTDACSAAHPGGCPAQLPTLTVGPGLGPPALDAATHTLYAPYGGSANEVAVIDAGTCNATTQTGCGQTPASVAVGQGTNLIAVSQATDTVYAPSAGDPFGSGDTVAVINGATCNATDHNGCLNPVATVDAGPAPQGVAVDDATHSVYVGIGADGDSPGALAIIDSATCNGADPNGCRRPVRTVGVGRGPTTMAIDLITHAVYIAAFADALVSMVNGATCNATDGDGCSSVAEQAVISGPFTLAVDPVTNTVYDANAFSADSTLSVFRGLP